MNQLRTILAFGDQDLESRYRQHAAQKHTGAVRLAITLAIALYLVFGVLDATLCPERLTELWILRYAVISPFLVASLVLSWVTPTFFLRHQQGVLVAVSLVGGAGIVAMTIICQPLACHSYYAGLLLVLIFIHTLARLRFITASLVSLALIIAYEIVAISVAPVPVDVLVANNFYLVATAMMGMLASHTIERMDRKAFLDLQTIQELSVRDHLTGLYNRRHLQDRIQELIDIFQRYRVPSCLVLVDLDGFKQVNDRLGHPVGDTVLRQVARVFMASARTTDLVFRFGGDEFCLLLPNTEQEAAQAMMGRVRAALLELRFGEGDDALGIDMSGGCVSIDAKRRRPEQVIEGADGLLLEAKRQGKGRVLSDA